LFFLFFTEIKKNLFRFFSIIFFFVFQRTYFFVCVFFFLFAAAWMQIDNLSQINFNCHFSSRTSERIWLNCLYADIFQCTVTFIHITHNLHLFIFSQLRLLIIFFCAAAASLPQLLYYFSFNIFFIYYFFYFSSFIIIHTGSMCEMLSF
jgi:hypothetical protein